MCGSISQSETVEEYTFIYIYIYDLFVGFAWDGYSAGCMPVHVEMFLIDTQRQARVILFMRRQACTWLFLIFMQGVEGFGFRLRFLCLHPYAYVSNGTHTTQSLACVLPLCHPDFVKSFYSIQEEHKAECVGFFYIFF